MQLVSIASCSITEHLSEVAGSIYSMCFLICIFKDRNMISLSHLFLRQNEPNPFSFSAFTVAEPPNHLVSSPLDLIQYGNIFLVFGTSNRTHTHDTQS